LAESIIYQLSEVDTGNPEMHSPLDTTLRLERAFGGCRILAKGIVRTLRSALEPAAAIGTLALETRAGALGTEGALERTNHGVARIRRKIPIATLAVWLHEQHVTRSPLTFIRSYARLRAR
jgi:hypothetical protein